MGKISYLLIAVIALILVLTACERASITGAGCPKCEECPECPDCILDCTTCPAKYEYKEVIVYKYVCENGVTVNNKEDCALPIDYDLRNGTGTTNQTYVEEVQITSACIYGNNGGEIYFEVSTFPKVIDFQIKEVGEEGFRTILELENLYSATRTFDFEERYSKADFSLEDGKLYVFRILFDFNIGVNKLGKEYSDEFFIDGREGGAIFAKKC